MKEKVLAALKTRYSNLGLSEKVLGRVAAYVAKTVKEENEIENAVSDSDIKDMLSEMQSDADRLRTERQKALSELEELKKAPKDDGKKDDDKNKGVELPEDIKNALDYINSLKERDKANETKSKLDTLKSQAIPELEKKGISKSLCDKYLKDISYSENLTANDLITKATEEHNYFISEFSGDGIGKSRMTLQNAEGKTSVDSYLENKTNEIKRQAEIAEKVIKK